MQITNKISTKSIKIPKHFNISCNSLMLHSELTLKDYTIDVTNPISDNDYYTISVDFENIPDGEYIYNLKNNNTIVSSGIIILGEYKQDNKQYNNEQEYTEYRG